MGSGDAVYKSESPETVQTQLIACKALQEVKGCFSRILGTATHMDPGVSDPAKPEELHGSGSRFLNP